MPSLSDHIDRLSQHAKSIRYAAESTGTSVHALNTEPGGPFARAVLNTSLGDLIRDVDPAELGLFTLITPARPIGERDTRAMPKDEVSRIEFHGATPLRRPTRKEDNQKLGEPEPEVYAQAALKYLDRYQSIRPMPRARAEVEAIVEELAILRENVQSLTLTLEQSLKGKVSDAPSSPRSLANIEERRIQDLQSRISEVRKRKEIVAMQRGMRNKISRPKVSAIPPAPAPPLSSSKTDPQEDMFWNTPAAPTRTLQFTDNLLMDEQVDLGDVSGTSLVSPIPPPRPTFVELGGGDETEALGEPALNVLDKSTENGVVRIPIDLKSELNEGDDDDGGDGEDEDEKTVVLKKLPQLSQLPEVSPQSSLPSNAPEAPDNEPELRSPTTAKKSKIKVNSGVERIVMKIWTTVGEIIMPGHLFDVSGNTNKNKPLRAKETIVHLQSLAANSPSSPAATPLSPASSASSLAALAGAPNAQQVLTAQLLLTLLGGPMPLGQLKDALGGGSAATRTVYACVAKRLVKIERGGGEQIVKFDV